MAMEPPCSPPGRMSIPSPILHRRNRTKSQSETAASAELGRGTVVEFCRERGHGFIKPDGDGDSIFLHVYDIEGEVIPNHGDIVEYRKMLIPPKNEKYQAVHVKIVNFAPGRHRTWNDPPSSS
ncbi:cold-shock DNA-binding domain protein [Opisthorchis viverrini]|nr:cold-shock DNA-binding domain protein [Opisthorchis viverrini]